MHADVSKFNVSFVQNIYVFLVEALLTGEVTLDKKKDSYVLYNPTL